MNSEIIPPSPNWYCSKATDTNKEGTFLFAARHSVCLFNARKTRAEFLGHLIGHTERVVGVAFSKNDGQSNLCASVSEDLSVRVWDIKSLSELHRHDSHKDKPTAMDWSPLGKDLIVTGDEKGAILYWNFIDMKVKSFTPEHGHIFCLSCSPHNVADVIVGYKSGIVLVVDIGKRGGIIHKLRGHDDEVHSVVWCPIPGEDITITKESSGSVQSNDQQASPPNTNGCLLASSSRDRTIRVWNMSQGKAVMTLRLPSRVSGFRAREKIEEDSRRSRVWLTLYWPKNSPRRFISSSHSGDILCWDLCRPGKNKWDVFGQADGVCHTRIVFNISFGGDAASKTFITTSMDRQIIKWNMDSLQSEWNMPSLGGFMYCLATSPLDPGRLAIGSGDNLIRVWNTSSLSNPHDITTFWQGIKSKVTALAWHPKIEGWLAYGTDDGRVGIYDVFANRPPRLSSTYHKRTVYRVCWGPVCSKTMLTGEKSSISLYSCAGEGIILEHNPTKLDSDAVNINHIISDTNDIKHIIPQRTELSWRPDGDAVAIGNEDGSIELFQAPNLLQICTIFAQHKLINCLQWFPDCSSQSESSADQSNQSEKRFWLASGSSEPMIHVYDLKDTLIGKTLKQCSKQITNSFCVLHGHTMKVTDLSWNPARNGQLASASYDGTVQVWDVVNKGNPIANFRGHSGRVLGVEWSVLDEDSICSGGDDFTLMRWNVSKQQHTKPPKNKKEAQQMIYSRPKGKTKRKKEKKGYEKSEQNTNKEDSSVAKPPSEMSFDELLEQRKKEILQEKMESKESMMAANQDGPQATFDSSTVEGDRQIDQQALKDIRDGSGASGDMSGKHAVELLTCKPKKSDGRKRRKVKSLFPISGSLDNRGKTYLQEDCIKIAEIKYGAPGRSSSDIHAGSGDHTHLGLFAGRREVYAMFREEEKYHVDAGNPDSYYCLELWKGNIVGVLHEATEKQQLTDHLVAMSTLGGHDVFLATAEAYAKQLVHLEFYSKAVSYYLACHKVYEAIDVLSQHKRHREALSLACVRLSPSDPVLQDLYKVWAQTLESEGNYEQAAKCYMQIGEPASAVRLLARKGDRPSLTTALKVATITNEMDAAAMLISSFVFECLQSNDWTEARSVIETIKDMLHFEILLDVHEVLVKCVKDDNSLILGETKITFTAVDISKSGKVNDSSRWPFFEMDGRPCLQFIIHKLLHKNHVEDDFSWQSVYDNLLRCRQSIGGTMMISQVLVQVAIDVTLGQLSVMLDRQMKASEHWLQAVTLCHNDGYYEIAKVIFGLIFTKDQMESYSGFSQTYNAIEDIMSRCLYGYFTCSVLYDVWWGYSMTHRNLNSNATELDCKLKETQTKDAVIKATEVSGHCMSEQQTDIGNLLSTLFDISNVLLSAPHFQLWKLRNGLKYIKEAVSKLLSRHNEHVVDPCGGIQDDDIISDANNGLESRKLVVESKVDTRNISLEEKLTCINSIETTCDACSSQTSGNSQDFEKKYDDHDMNTSTNQTETKGGGNLMANQSTEAELQTNLSTNDNTEELQTNLSTNDNTEEKLKSIVSTNQNAESELQSNLTTNQNIEVELQDVKRHEMPEKWDDYPLDEKYTHPAVTLAILTKEQTKILDALAEIPDNMKEHSFPCPMETAMLLVYFSHHFSLKHGRNSEVQRLCQKAIQQGEQFAVTKMQKKFFEKYRKK